MRFDNQDDVYIFDINRKERQPLGNAGGDLVRPEHQAAQPGDFVRRKRQDRAHGRI